ncbi:EAL and HDOD domain-containing protein [Sulfurimonas sp.]|uniref:EAL and HDOD domain-containing protein n=1 Tax=Sulfurimonas sp. TaxID=2022749 RepID=UPI003D0CBAB6
MEHIYLARQVILRDDLSLFAYEVLYRDSQKGNKVENDRYASSAVISSVLNRFGTKEVLLGKRAFIKVDEKFLLSDLIFSIPNEFFIFSLFDDIEVDEKIVQRLEQLHRQGYLLGISDAALNLHTFTKYSNVLDYFSYFKLDFSQKFEDEVETMLETLKESRIKIVGSKIDTHEKFELAQELGCDYFQGYFFAEPKILENKKFEAYRVNVLHLYNLLMQETNIDELTSEFEKNPEISIQLLQFINSGAFFFRKKIASIHHVITLLGRMKLAQWLMLMIYSKSVSNDSGHSPLMEMVQTRAVMMENILKVVKPDSGSNMLGEAYFVGVLSLMDVVFGISLRELLDGLFVSDEVKDAILEGKGLLGNIFEVVKNVEAFDIGKIMAFEEKYSLEQESIKKAIAQSIDFEGKFGRV